jgi:hypothetical protein
MADIEPLPPIQGLKLVRPVAAMKVMTAAQNIPIRRSN